MVRIEPPGQGAVLIYGAEHTRDPGDPQIGDIRRRFEEFSPTVALVESDLGMLFPPFFVADGGSFNVYLDAGAIDQGFEMLVRDVETGRPHSLTSIWRAPNRHLLNHSRFLEVAEKWGLMDYWAERGAPDLCKLVRAELRCQ